MLSLKQLNKLLEEELILYMKSRIVDLIEGNAPIEYDYYEDKNEFRDMFYNHRFQSCINDYTKIKKFNVRDTKNSEEFYEYMYNENPNMDKEEIEEEIELFAPEDSDYILKGYRFIYYSNLLDTYDSSDWEDIKKYKEWDKLDRLWRNVYKMNSHNKIFNKLKVLSYKLQFKQELDKTKLTDNLIGRVIKCL